MMTTTKLAALVFGVILAVCSAGERAAAQSAYPEALKAEFRALNDQASKLYSDGKFWEGIAEAHKFETAVKAKLGVEDPYYASALQTIGHGYFFLSNMSAAEGLFNRALAIRKKAFGENHRAVANNLNDLALVYSSQRKFAEAEKCFKESLAIEQQLGGDKREMATTLNNLARLYWSQGRYDEAEPMIKQVLEIDEEAKGPNHPNVATSLSVLAAIYQSQRKYADATRTRERELAIMEQVYGPNDAEVVRPLHGLAILGMSTNVGPNIARTLGYSRRAIAVESANQAVARSGLDDGNRSPIGLRPSVFRRGLSVFAVAAALGAEPRSALGVEGFEAAQWATLSSAAAAVQQMGLRFSAGNDGLAVLVRERQDLTVRWREVDRSLASALGSPESQRNTAAADAIRGRRAEIQSQLASVVAKLEKDFPDYAALASPKALKVAEVQQLLGADEALVYWMIDENRSFVFALSREAFDWQVIPLGEKELTAGVGYFRRGLDVGVLNSPEALSGKKVLFDLPLANRFYNALLGPVASVVRTKRHLLVVPSGPLTALPFYLLVTDPPSGEADIRSLALYREAAWLLRRHAVTVLPSVSSLKTLRVLAPTQHAARPMVGFGDPVFDAAAGARRPAKRAPKIASRAYTDFWQGIGVDRGELAKALPRLEDTADELKAVAKNLGAPPGDIYLRNAASEGKVKDLPLADFRVVYFATHGLVAGDVKGLGEPSLALTIPKQPTDLDDGLLTASEIAQLKLNADWVVLSACNTIAGDKPGAEALSGLARSFFYAGARALLVSHWAVSSAAATRLTVSTFDNLRINPAIGRAEALRRAMFVYLNDASSPSNAYPAFWGPFALIGEGTTR